MPNRVVSYVFRGNFTNLSAGLVGAGRGVGDLGNRLSLVEAKAKKAGSSTDAFGVSAKTAGLSVGVLVVGMVAAVSAAADFDAQMSNVKATGADAAGSMDQLRVAAISAGAATKYSATEAGEGIENLLKAGVSASDVLTGGLSGALDLAAAGSIEVADAAEIAATALTQFKLEGDDIPHVADLLAAGAGKAQGSVGDLSMALKQSGLVASQMGLSVEETTGTLAAFASAGLLGSDAGTSFRTMLLRLANPSEESAGLMKSLGIAAYDTSGQFVGMSSIAGQLQTAFEGKTQAERDSALATIFGSDAIRAASVLYSQGSEGVDKWTDSVNDAGYAVDVATTKMDNLKGDLERLKGAFQTALVSAGEGGQGPARDVTQLATAYLDQKAEGSRTDVALASKADSVADLAQRLSASNVGAYAKQFDIDINKLSEDLVVYGEKGEYVTEVQKMLAGETGAAQSAFYTIGPALFGYANETTKAITVQDDLGAIIGKNSGLLGQGEGALDKAGEAELKYSSAATVSAESIAAQNDVLATNIQAMKDRREAALNAFDAETNWGASLKAARVEAAKGERGLNKLTKGGRENRAAISDLAQAWNNQSEAVKATPGRYRAARKAFVDLAQDMGLSKQKAKELADQLLEIPTNTKAKVSVDIAAANAGIGSINAALSALDNRRVVARVGIQQARAMGGYISGPGTGTSDSIDARLSNGEYVVNAKATAMNRQLLDTMNFGDPRRFAEGGYAGDTGGGGSKMSAYTSARSVEKLGRSADKASKSIDRETGKRDLLTARRDATRSAVTDAFRSDIFATDTSNPWSSKASANPNGTLRSDIANARKFNSAIDSLEGKGLGGAALADILNRGDLDLAQEYASQSRSSLAQYEHLYNRRERVTSGVGAAAGNAVAGAQLRELKRLGTKLDRLDRSVRGGAKETGDAVLRGVNRRASNGRRRNHRGAATEDR